MTDAMKHKLKIAAIVIIVLIVALPIILVIVSYYIHISKNNMIKNYYYSDTEKFNEISSYFKNLYTDNLIYAEIKDDILLSVYETKDGKDVLSKDVSSEKVNLALVELREKYQKNSQYPIFSRINAYYDGEGNMLLILKANTIPIKKRKNIEYVHDITSYYLVYIDEHYNGNGSFLAIDSFSVTREPFADNWCIWSENQALN